MSDLIKKYSKPSSRGLRAARMVAELLDDQDVRFLQEVLAARTNLAAARYADK